LKVSAAAEDSYEHLEGFNTDYLAKSGGEQNIQVKAGKVNYQNSGITCSRGFSGTLIVRLKPANLIACHFIKVLKMHNKF
jgi:hypothetical protein